MRHLNEEILTLLVWLIAAPYLISWSTTAVSPFIDTKCNGVELCCKNTQHIIIISTISLLVYYIITIVCIMYVLTLVIILIMIR